MTGCVAIQSIHNIPDTSQCVRASHYQLINNGRYIVRYSSLISWYRCLLSPVSVLWRYSGWVNCPVSWIQWVEGTVFVSQPLLWREGRGTTLYLERERNVVGRGNLGYRSRRAWDWYMGVIFTLYRGTEHCSAVFCTAVQGSGHRGTVVLCHRYRAVHAVCPVPQGAVCNSSLWYRIRYSPDCEICDDTFYINRHLSGHPMFLRMTCFLVPAILFYYYYYIYYYYY